jgi:mRNA interferase MazF
MGTFTVGSIVLVPFPFSDLSTSKLRPAVVLAEVGRGDRILCQITSNPYSDTLAIMLDDTCLESGALRITSYARPGKIFTANDRLIVRQVAKLQQAKFKELIEAVVKILSSGLSS